MRLTERELVKREMDYRARMRASLAARFDANETIFLERELTQLRQKLFFQLFPESIARTFAPKATDIAASAETYSYKVYKPIGVAEVVAYKNNDIPRIDLIADEVLGKVRPVAAAYGWDINELRESARLGTQLSELKARTVREAIERGIDDLLAFGTLSDPSGNRSSIGLTGLANSSIVVSATTVQNATSFWLNSSGVPGTLTATQLLADLTSFVMSVNNQSNGIFNADTLILPLTHYNYIAELPFSTLTGDSVLTIFKKNNPQIKSVVPWYKLNLVSSAQGGNALPRAIAYQKDPMVLESVIPQEFEQLPPETQGFEFVINCQARCGGHAIYQPLGMKYMDFPQS